MYDQWLKYPKIIKVLIISRLTKWQWNVTERLTYKKNKQVSR